MEQSGTLPPKAPAADLRARPPRAESPRGNISPVRAFLPEPPETPERRSGNPRHCSRGIERGTIIIRGMSYLSGAIPRFPAKRDSITIAARTSHCPVTDALPIRPMNYLTMRVRAISILFGGCSWASPLVHRICIVLVLLSITALLG